MRVGRELPVEHGRNLNGLGFRFLLGFRVSAGVPGVVLTLLELLEWRAGSVD